MRLARPFFIVHHLPKPVYYEEVLSNAFFIFEKGSLDLQILATWPQDLANHVAILIVDHNHVYFRLGNVSWKKNCCSFGFGPNEGWDPAQIFWHI